jgi:hypothetical protein
MFTAKFIPCLALSALLAGCTFEDGSGFATIRDARVSAALVPGEARDLGNRTVLTNLAYRVQLDQIELELGDTSLEEVQTQGGGGDVQFDPANPPAGYTFCHSGHCHAEDGSLVSYEDIEVELAGGSEAFAPVVTLQVDGAFDLWAPETRLVRRFAPSRELPRTTLRRCAVGLARLTATGSVSGGPQGAGLGDTTLPLSVDLPLADQAIDRVLSLSIDRDGPGEVSVRVALVVDGTLFDDVEFGAIAVDGAVVIAAPESDAALKLAERMGEAELSVEIREHGD